MWKHQTRYLSEEEKDGLAIKMGLYMMDNKCSIRDVADDLCYHRSTVYRYLTERLRYVDDELYQEVKYLLRTHKGGMNRDYRTGRFIKCN